MNEPSDKFLAYRFPAPGNLVIHCTASRSGSPVGWSGKYPVYAKYTLWDEFDNPIYSPAIGWFETATEAIFVARLYERIMGEPQENPRRRFPDAFIRYLNLRDRLADLAFDDKWCEKVLGI